MSDEQAKMVAAIAGTTGKALDVIQSVGSFITGGSDTVFHNAVGVLGGDWLKHRRERNLAHLTEETRVYLAKIDAKRQSEPSPSIVLPILTMALDEEREQLRKLWAALLANAAIDGGKKVRREFFETLRKLEPVDAIILDLIAKGTTGNTGSISRAGLDRFINERYNSDLVVLDTEVSLIALTTLQCVVEILGYASNAERTSTWSLTHYGKALLRALVVD